MRTREKKDEDTVNCLWQHTNTMPLEEEIGDEGEELATAR
jgi:hypothetical protein